MGRIRTIKPEFFLHEDLYDLEVETGLPIRVAFAGLWCQADRMGRFRWRPRALKAQVLPFDDCDFSRVLHALTTRGFILKYASNGEEFGCIPGFLKHQVVNNREAASILPDPDASNCQIDTSTRAPRVPHACPTPLVQDQGEGKGRERKGKEHIGVSTKVTPRFVKPTLQEVAAYCLERKNGIDPQTFVDHYERVGWVVGQNKTPMKCWMAAVRTWEARRREQKAADRANGRPDPDDPGVPLYGAS